MQAPLFDGKPHAIVNGVLKYLASVGSIDAKDKVSFSQVKKRICKELIAPLLGIDMGFNKHPNVKGLDGIRRKKFLIDTLEGCRFHLSLNKSTMNHGTKMVMEGLEVRNEKVKKYGIRHAPYKYSQLKN